MPASTFGTRTTQAEQHYQPDPAYAPTRRDRKHRRMMMLERWFGWELSKKHYTLVR